MINISLHRSWRLPLNILLAGWFLAGFIFYLTVPTRVAAEPIETTVGVTASVALSDYFADLLASMSIVTARLDSQNRITVGIDIIATDGLHFAGHPVVIELLNEPNLDRLVAVQRISDHTGHIDTLIDLSNKPGRYQVRVIDLAYERPIQLVSQPIVIIPFADHQLVGTISRVNSAPLLINPLALANSLSGLTLKNHIAKDPSQVFYLQDQNFRHFSRDGPI